MVVVGGGHAGCEAALASARLGCRTLLLTLNLDRIAWQVRNVSGATLLVAAMSTVLACQTPRPTWMHAAPSGCRQQP